MGTIALFIHSPYCHLFLSVSPLASIPPSPTSSAPLRYVDRRTMDFGLLFTCRLGTIDLERPVALLQVMIIEGGSEYTGRW